jgi:hypothetical protein
LAKRGLEACVARQTSGGPKCDALRSAGVLAEPWSAPLRNAEIAR